MTALSHLASVSSAGRTFRAGVVAACLMFFLYPLAAHASAFLTHVLKPDTPQQTAPLVFEDQDGGQHALSDYRGRYVLLTIWATWCAPCLREMPALDARRGRIDDKKWVIVPLAEDRDGPALAAFYRAHAIARLPVAVDTAGIAPALFHLRGLPTTVVIDPRGFEIARIEGDVDWMSSQAQAFLGAIVSGQSHP